MIDVEFGGGCGGRRLQVRPESRTRAAGTAISSEPSGQERKVPEPESSTTYIDGVAFDGKGKASLCNRDISVTADRRYTGMECSKVDGK
jgi:hypothetical protein